MRKKTLKVDIIIIIVLVLIAAAIIAALVIPAYNGDDAAAGGRHEYMSLDEVADKNIGVMLGGVYEHIVNKNMPNANISFFDNASDMALAVTSGKIDGFACSQVQAEKIVKSDPGLKILTGSPGIIDVAFAFPKTDSGAKLRDEFNGYLAEITADGTLDKFKDKWLTVDEDDDIEDRTLSGSNGTLKMATTGTTEPYTFIKNDKNVGLDIELAYGFCRKYGYKLEISTMDFSAMIPALASSTYDFAGANITVTPERAESVYFSDRYTQNKVAIVVAGGSGEKHGVSYYADKEIGVITGTLFETFVKEHYPQAKMSFYNSLPDMVQALQTGKIDAFLLADESVAPLMEDVSGITDLDEIVGNFDIGMVFPKTEKADKIRAQMDEYLTKIKADGTLDSIIEFWKSEEGKHTAVDMSGLTGENGNLICATASDEVPCTFIVDGKVAGFDPDIVVHFCREYGYNVEIVTTDFSGVLPGLVAGIYDIAANTVVITEERKESVNFSVPYLHGPVRMIVRSEEEPAAGAASDFFDSIAESFEKNFIREDRWKMILDGVATTCLITAMSMLAGTVLAFLVCMFRRTGSRLANGIANIYVKLLQGTPMVVLLMILYYVVFGKSGLEAVWVAIIGFSLNFGAYASEIMRSGIESIDAGQREAALALGYSENQAFFRFIFPQAAVRFLPVYKQEIISLLKSTAIVGYIAIQDLTKMSDIIRSRTYEAFFPIIATAIIYFILAWIISLILKFVMNGIDFRRRKRGVTK